MLWAALALCVVLLGALYAWQGDEPLRWVRMLICLLRMRRAVKRFVSLNWTVADAFEERVRSTPYAIATSFQAYIAYPYTFASALFTDREWSYLELDFFANRVAAWGLSVGLKERDVVAIMMGNCPEFVGLWLGLSKIGVVSALLNTALRGESLRHCIQTTGPKLVISDSARASLASVLSGASGSLESKNRRITRDRTPWLVFKTSGDDAESRINISEGAIAGPDLAKFSPKQPSSEAYRRHTSPTSVLFYVFTSGTTGLPKAAKIIHARFYAAGAAFSIFNGLVASDRIYCALPLYHSAGGMIGVSMAVFTGAALIISKNFSVRRFFRECADSRATVVQYIGQICRYLVNSPATDADRRAHRVNKAIGNGLRGDTWKKFQEKFGIGYVGEFYAATEGNAVLINNQSRVGAVGYVPGIADYLPCVDYPIKIIKVDPDTGAPLRDRDGLCVRCGADEPGELVSRIQSNNVDRRFDGYLDAAATKKKVLTNVFRKGDCWFRSGDLLRRDAKGYFFFVDRLGDTFRWKGENVATSEVASAIRSCPSPRVADVVVYGVSVPNCDGKAGMACLQFFDSKLSADSSTLPTPAGLRKLWEHCHAHLPRYAVPVFLRVRSAAESLDVTVTFKHMRRALVKEGFSVSGADAVYVCCNAKRTWVPLGSAELRDVMEGKMRL